VLLLMLQPSSQQLQQGFRPRGPIPLTSRSSRPSGRHPPRRRQAITSAITRAAEQTPVPDGDGGADGVVNRN